MLLTYKYRLYPSQEQIFVLNRQLDGHRFLYNTGLANRKNSYELLGKSVSYIDQSKSIISQFRDNNPSVALCNYSSLQQTLKRLDTTFKSFFRRIKSGEKPGYPRFKVSNRFNSIKYSKLGDGCQIKNDKLYLQNVGNIKVKWHRKLPDTIKTLSVKRKNNKWYVHFVIECEPVKFKKTYKKIGIDVGITNFIFGSDGLKVEGPKFFRKSEKQIVKAQKKLSRRKKGSVRRFKARVLLSTVHEKVFNCRKNFFHKITHYLVNNYDKIAIENLSINNMIKNHNLAKSIADSAWGEFFNILICKAENAGKEVVKVNPYNTSQQCCKCKRIVKKDLSIRIHRCICGISIDRDHNAAINILKRAWTVPSVLALVRECHREASCF